MPKPVQGTWDRLELGWRNKGKWISLPAVVFLEVLSYHRCLTLKLQIEALVVIYAYRQVDSVISALKSMREGSDREFKRIFAKATTLGKQLNGEKFELEQPRVNKSQMHSSNNCRRVLLSLSL